MIRDPSEPGVPCLVTFVGGFPFELRARIEHELPEVRFGDGASSPKSLPEVKKQPVVVARERDGQIHDLLSDRRQALAKKRVKTIYVRERRIARLSAMLCK